MCVYCERYPVVFNSVVTEALPLSEALRDLLRIEIQVNARVEGQVPVYLREGLRTVHVGLPDRTTWLGTVAAFVVDWACGCENKEASLRTFAFF